MESFVSSAFFSTARFSEKERVFFHRGQHFDALKARVAGMLTRRHDVTTIEPSRSVVLDSSGSILLPYTGYIEVRTHDEHNTVLFDAVMHDITVQKTGAAWGAELLAANGEAGTEWTKRFPRCAWGPTETPFLVWMRQFEPDLSDERFQRAPAPVVDDETARAEARRDQLLVEIEMAAGLAKQSEAALAAAKGRLAGRHDFLSASFLGEFGAVRRTLADQGALGHRAAEAFLAGARESATVAEAKWARRAIASVVAELVGAEEAFIGEPSGDFRAGLSRLRAFTALVRPFQAEVEEATASLLRRVESLEAERDEAAAAQYRSSEKLRQARAELNEVDRWVQHAGADGEAKRRRTEEAGAESEAFFAERSRKREMLRAFARHFFRQRMNEGLEAAASVVETLAPFWSPFAPAFLLPPLANEDAPEFGVIKQKPDRLNVIKWTKAAATIADKLSARVEEFKAVEPKTPLLCSKEIRTGVGIRGLYERVHNALADELKDTKKLSEEQKRAIERLKEVKKSLATLKSFNPLAYLSVDPSLTEFIERRGMGRTTLRQDELLMLSLRQTSLPPDYHYHNGVVSVDESAGRRVAQLVSGIEAGAWRAQKAGA